MARPPPRALTGLGAGPLPFLRSPSEFHAFFTRNLLPKRRKGCMIEDEKGSRRLGSVRAGRERLTSRVQNGR